jgi:NADH:ubiquinone oxidoreductase subunit 5 (subunit L)/multisubunit Na+/H+ antiporter MnhA subunit
MVVLFFGAMMGLVFSGNLIFLYLFWEITAITSWRLIGFFREKQHVIRADKAFLVTMLGSVLMLIGFISIYQEYGSFDLAVLKNSHISNFAVSFHSRRYICEICDAAIAYVASGRWCCSISCYCFASRGTAGENRSLCFCQIIYRQFCGR